ncbi:MAG: 7TM diverse intracellular signaling domain-containing protein [Cytophagales bacterium]
MFSRKTPSLSFLLLILTIPFGLFAQRTIVLNDDFEEFEFLGEFYSIFEDKSTNLALYDILNDSTIKFNVKKQAYNFNENPYSAYWLKFNIKVDRSCKKHFLIESYNTHIKNLQLYIPNEEGKYEVHKAGTDFRFFDRDYIHQNIIFDLKVPTDSLVTIYARVYSFNHAGFDFRIKTNNFFVFYTTNEYLFLGLFYGIMFVMAVYNFLLYISVRDKIYLYYVFYVMAAVLSTLTDDSLGMRYIWFSAPVLDSFIGHIIAPNLLLASFVIYAYHFLNISEQKNKFIKQSIFGTIAVYIVYFLIEKFFLPYGVNVRIFHVLPFITIYAVAIYLYFKGQKTSKYFIIGYTFILLSFFIIQLRASGSIDGNIFTVYSFNYGLVFEIVVFSFGLSERIRNIIVEREIAQQQIIQQLEENNQLQEEVNLQLEQNNLLNEKVNRELEEKVKERTVELERKNEELEEANQKLKEITEKANAMAAKLDMDNWNLQKYVKEEIKARISDQEVPYDEFVKIFPNEHACFKYLDELKWKDQNFTCRKCKNNKFIKGVKAFSRKCTRCGYVESVTAYTLFHGVRFEIDKAFYMTYIVHRRGTKITLDQLSDLLKLRRNTCWNFKKKILQTIDEYKEHHNSQPPHWENIVLDRV